MPNQLRVCMRSVSAMLLRSGSQRRSEISPRELRVVNLAVPVLIQDVEKVVADGERDKYFTAEEAKEYGLVDEVFEHQDKKGA